MYQRSRVFPDRFYINNIHRIILHCQQSSPIQINWNKLAYECLQISREIWLEWKTALWFQPGSEYLSSAGNLAFQTHAYIYISAHCLSPLERSLIKAYPRICLFATAY